MLQIIQVNPSDDERTQMYKLHMRASMIRNHHFEKTGINYTPYTHLTKRCYQYSTEGITDEDAMFNRIQSDISNYLGRLKEYYDKKKLPVINCQFDDICDELCYIDGHHYDLVAYAVIDHLNHRLLQTKDYVKYLPKDAKSEWDAEAIWEHAVGQVRDDFDFVISELRKYPENMTDWELQRFG